MNSLWVIIPVSVTVAVLVYWFAFRKKKQILPPLTSGITVPETMIRHPRSDGGAWFSTNPVAEETRPIVGQVIIDALAEMIVAAKYHNPSWTRYLNTADYQVFFIPPMATNMDGSPALLIQGVQSAGTVINIDGSDMGVTPWIVLPEQAQWNYLDYLKNSVHNEGEHAIERMNDYTIYLSFTGAYDVHPHWQAPPIGGEAA